MQEFPKCQVLHFKLEPAPHNQWPAAHNQRENKLIDILRKYNIKTIWHFTDKSNIDLIESQGGLLALGELQRRGVAIPAPGGNQWSHDADRYKGVHEYVHAAFLDDHPMLYAAKQDARIVNPCWLEIDSSIILEDDVLFTNDVSNKAGSQLLTADLAREQIDFEVLFTYMDWKVPEVQARRRAALKSEVLIPRWIPLDKILGMKNG